MTDERTTQTRTEIGTETGSRAKTSAFLERGSRRRALCKALLYRVVMLLTTVVIALAVTGDPGIALDIGVATTIVKTATYYGYERLWNAI